MSRLLAVPHLDKQIQAEWARRRLRKFIELMWPVLEPGREFVGGWPVDAICEHLEAVTDGQIKRLLINVPPGCMKSMTTNVFWPAWEWGPRNLPANRYVTASYSASLTIRDNRRCRQLITSETYQQLWGSRFTLMEDQNAKVRYDTDKTGFKIATSVGGLGTGERGDRFIIDDPHNVKESESDQKRENVLQWFTEVVPTRINEAEKSAIVIIMQRVHERDVSGHILAEELGYEHLCLPMEYERDHPFRSTTVLGFEDPRKEDGELLWPERFSKPYLDDDLKPHLRSWGGDYAVAGQLQQRPAPRGGGMFKRDNFEIVDRVPTAAGRRVRGWDLAGTKDDGAYTVGALVRLVDGKLYIEDVVRGQWSSLVMEQQLQHCAAVDGKSVVISVPQDPGQAGKAQKAHLAGKLHGFNVHFSPESGSKEDRARPVAAQVEAGTVFLVRGEWNNRFLDEFASFPRGARSDQVDAVSRAYAYLVEKRSLKVGVAPKVLPAG